MIAQIKKGGDSLVEEQCSECIRLCYPMNPQVSFQGKPPICYHCPNYEAPEHKSLYMKPVPMPKGYFDAIKNEYAPATFETPKPKVIGVNL